MHRRHLLAALPGALAAASFVRPALGATQLSFATPYPETNFMGQNNKMFADGVTSASGGALNVKRFPNATLLPMGQIKRGVQTGQVQIGEILLNAYGNDDPFFELDGIPRLAGSWEELRRLLDLARPYIEARFQKQGMMLLYQVPWPPTGFYTNVELPNIEALKGMRLRTYSALSNRFAALVGATPALVQIPEVPQAFATNVIGAMITSAPSGTAMQAWDFAKVFTPVDFSYSGDIIFMNRRAFDALPKAQQELIREQAALAEKRGWEMAQEAHVTEMALLAKNGVKVMKPSKDLMDGLDKVQDKLVEEWLERAGPDGRALMATYRRG